MTKPHSRTSNIRRAQKESAIFRLLSSLVHEATLEKPALAGMYVNRVELSPGKTVATAYIYSAQGKDHFQALLHELTLFKPSMRKALAQELQSRYTPDIVFRFDEQLQKTLHIENLLDTVVDTNVQLEEEPRDS
jgi:ribosome-binding factor A